MKHDKNASLLVARIANPFFHYEFDQHVPVDVLDKAVDIAAGNRILPLLYWRCKQSEVRLPRKAEELMKENLRRQREQQREMVFVTELCNKMRIDFVFFKTRRPFTYIPDDIDMLLRQPTELQMLTQALIENGYSLLKVGTPEITMRKITDHTRIDLDIHTTVSVGHLRLMRNESIWDNVTSSRLEDGFPIPVLNRQCDAVIGAAYALLKDFTVTIPVLYAATDVLLNQNIPKLELMAKKDGLNVPLQILMSTANSINGILWPEIEHTDLPSNWLIKRIIDADLRQGMTLPYAFPGFVVAYAYVSKARSELERHNMGVLGQLIRQPSSKGIGIFVDYLRFLKEK
jgi:hypothetical protein